MDIIFNKAFAFAVIHYVQFVWIISVALTVTSNLQDVIFVQRAFI